MQKWERWKRVGGSIFGWLGNGPYPFLGNLGELSLKNMTKQINLALMKYCSASNSAPRIFRHKDFKQEHL